MGSVDNVAVNEKEEKIIWGACKRVKNGLKLNVGDKVDTVSLQYLIENM